jgi:hypothetical protein
LFRDLLSQDKVGTTTRFAIWEVSDASIGGVYSHFLTFDTSLRVGSGGMVRPEQNVFIHAA